MENHEPKSRRIGGCLGRGVAIARGIHPGGPRAEVREIPEKTSPACPHCKQPMVGGHGGIPWTCFRGCESVKQDKPDRTAGSIATNSQSRSVDKLARGLPADNQGFSAHGAEDSLSKHIESQSVLIKEFITAEQSRMYMRELRAQCQILKDAFGT